MSIRNIFNKCQPRREVLSIPDVGDITIRELNAQAASDLQNFMETDAANALLHWLRLSIIDPESGELIHTDVSELRDVPLSIAAAGSLLGSARLEGTMNAVEYNTRASMIHLGVIIDQILYPLNNYIQGPLNGWLVNMVQQLDEIRDSNWQMLGRTGTGGGAGGPSHIMIESPYSPVANFYMYETSDANAVAQFILDKIHANDNGYGARLVEDIKRLMPGVVTVAG